MSRDRILLAVLLVLVALPYVPGLSNGFVWLDHREIVEGDLIAATWAEVPGLFVEDRNFQGYHRPVYNLLHSLDRALWGLDPFGFHLSSLLLHLVNVALAVSLARLAGLGRGAALALGGLWGLHPINTAAVGLIHAKADLASATTLGLALLLLLRGLRVGEGESVHGPRFGLCVGSIATFVVALLTKEVAFVLPAGLLLGWLLGARPPRETAWAFWGVTATIAAIAAATFLQRVAHGNPYESPIRLGERLLTFTTVYVDALRRTLLPLELSIGDTVTRFSALAAGARARALVTFGALVALQLGALRAWAWSRPWILLLNLALLPVAQIVPILHFRADRFLYLPTLAALGFAVAGVERAVRAIPSVRFGNAARVAAGVVALALAGAYAYRDAARVHELSDDVTLFTAELRRTPDYVEGLAALARALDRAGRHDAAAPLWERALVVDDARIGYRNLDVIVVSRSHNLLARGRHDEARRFLLEHRDLVAGDAARESALYNLAVASYRLERYGEARGLLEGYVELHPLEAPPWLLLGACAIGTDDPEAARTALEAFLELAPPDDPDRGTVRGWLEEL